MPAEHWRCLRTNNPLERLMREIRRRTRVVAAFPDGKSALMLVAARLRHVAATKWGTKRYLQMNRLAEVVAIALAVVSPGQNKSNDKNNNLPTKKKQKVRKTLDTTSLLRRLQYHCFILSDNYTAMKSSFSPTDLIDRPTRLGTAPDRWTYLG